MRTLIVVCVVLSAVTLTAMVGARIHTEALAVVIGVAFGAAAGIPVSLLLLASVNLRRRFQADGWEAIDPAGRRAARPGAYPPVVVIQGGQPSPAWSQSWTGGQMPPPFYGATAEAAPRQFRLVGAEEWEQPPA